MMPKKLSKEEKERIKKLQDKLKMIKFTPEEVAKMQEDARELKKFDWKKLYQPFTI